MASFGVRRTPKWAALVLAAAAAVATAFAQPALESSADRQREIVARIEQEESRNGPHSEGLIEPLTALAFLYQEGGDSGLASAVIERVRQVVRANYGLHTLAQAPLLRQLIAAEEARGDFAGAWHLEQELLVLARRHPDDLRTVPILRGIADERLEVLSRYLAGEHPPQIELGCYYDWSQRDDDAGSCTSGGRRDVVQALVSDAQRNYADAIAIMLRNELYASAELRELEMGLVESSNLIRHQNELKRSRRPPFDVMLAPLGADRLEPWRSTIDAMVRLAEWDIPDARDSPALRQDERRKRGARFRIRSQYDVGKASLERLLAYEAVTSAPTLAQVEALVRIADWELLHSRNGSALEGYEQAYGMLQKMGAAQASIDRMFSPNVPVALPAFSPNPLSADEAGQSAGYVDIAFEITQYGVGRRIEILEAPTDAGDAAKDIARSIARSRFRPQVADGHFARASPVVVRLPLD